MRRGRIYTHNPVPPPDQDGFIELAPHDVREALDAYDQWTDKRRAPPMVKELMLVLSIELERHSSHFRTENARSKPKFGPLERDG